MTNQHVTVIDPGTYTTKPYNLKNKKSAIELTVVKNITKQLKIQILDELDSDHLASNLQFKEITIGTTFSNDLYLKQTDWKKFREVIHNEISITNQILIR